MRSFCSFCFQLQGTELLNLCQARPGAACLAHNLVFPDRRETSEGAVSTNSGIFSGGASTPLDSSHIWTYQPLGGRTALPYLHSFHVMVVTLWMVASGWIWVLI